MANKSKISQTRTNMCDAIDYRKYLPVKNMGAAEWYSQLSFRWRFLPKGKDKAGQQKPMTKQDSSLLAQNIWARELINQPIVTLKRIEKLHPTIKAHPSGIEHFGWRENFGDMLIDAFLLPDIPNSHVVNLTVGQIYSAISTLGQDTLTAYELYQENEIDAFLQHLVSSEKKYNSTQSNKSLPSNAEVNHTTEEKAWNNHRKALRSPCVDPSIVGYSSRIMISLDINMPLSWQLKLAVDGIKLHNALYIKKDKSISFSKPVAFAEWYKRGFLLYLDARIVSWTYDQEICWEKLTDKIQQFDKSRKLDPKSLRKRLIDYERRIMSRTTLKMLETQALWEKQTGRTPSNKLELRL